jgi:hypothetical protein
VLLVAGMMERSGFWVGVILIMIVRRRGLITGKLARISYTVCLRREFSRCQGPAGPGGPQGQPAYHPNEYKSFVGDPGAGARRYWGAA